MFCPKCGAPAPPKQANGNVSAPPPPNRPTPTPSRPPSQPQPGSTQPRPPINQAPPTRSGPTSQSQQPQRPSAPNQSSDYRPPVNQSTGPLVDDIDAPRKKKIDPLEIAQKQVLRAAERFKEEDTPVEDHDEHFSWDSASALEHSISNVNKKKERKQDQLYGELSSRSSSAGSDGSSGQSGGIFDELERSENSFGFTPSVWRLIYIGIALVIASIGFLIGESVGSSGSTSGDDSNEHVNIFTGRVTLSKLEGLWLGTDTVNGAQVPVEYIFTDPGSLTVLTLGTNGAITNAAQSSYTFSQNNLTTSSNAGSTTTNVGAPPPTDASISASANEITLKATDRTLVLHRPTSIYGNWIQTGTEGNSFRYTFGSGNKATIPNPAETTGAPQPIDCNFVLSGNSLTLVQKDSITPVIKWSISFSGTELLLTSTDNNGVQNTIHLHQQ